MIGSVVIGLDTNVIVRYLAQDDPEQSALASDVFEGLSEDEPGYVSLVALVETVWVLRRAYQQSREQVHAVVSELLRARELRIHDAEIVHRALNRGVEFDLPDLIISEVALEAGCTMTLTLDRKAALIPGMQLLVSRPNS